MQPETERGREVIEIHIIDTERMKLREITTKRSHPDITDRFGRVWVWKDRDLYVHDGLIAIPENFVRDPDIQLPNRKLRGNPNYAGLCEICTSEW